ncbi:MAG: hypothetical protein GY815_10780 [Gammaproteobacteria bacterium]|nr:hypothetical protein [Gammaproteobacteria bacterium]
MNVVLSFSFNPARTAAFLSVIMSILLLAHVLALQANYNDALGIKRALGFEYWQIALFDLDEEESLGTWFSSAMLLFAALLFNAQAVRLRAAGDQMHRWWFVLALGFALMSVDEVVGLHELINTLYDETLWAGLSAAIVALVGLGFLPFLWRYRVRTSVLFLLGGLLFSGGSVGVEQLSGTDINSLGYNMLTGLEEGMEMSGVILSIYAVLDLMRENTIG